MKWGHGEMGSDTISYVVTPNDVVKWGQTPFPGEMGSGEMGSDTISYFVTPILVG